MSARCVLPFLLLSTAVAGDIPARRREPVALAIVDEGKTLLVANRQSGSLSVIDLDKRRTVGEHDIGRGLSDLDPLPGGSLLLAVDRSADELLLIACKERTPRVVDRIKVAPDPVRVVATSDGAMAIVASTGSRRLTFVRLKPRITPSLENVGSLALPFSPRELAVFPEGSHLVAADAYGGRLAVVEPRTQTIASIRTIPAHNIRGMRFAPDGQTLLLAHQYLNRLARSTFDDVHWGQLIRNHLRELRVDALKTAASDASLLDGGRLFDLGDVNYAAGDPGAIGFDGKGGVIVAIEGMDEVAMRAAVDQGSRRVVVGRRPVAVVVDSEGGFAYVADALDDTIAVVDVATGQRPTTIALGPVRVPSAIESGKQLFTSAKVSHDGWMSCQSCHTDGHTNGLAVDTLGDGSYGAPKRVPSLLGVGDTGPWTWTGSMKRLDDQVRKSIATTMHGTKLTDARIADLTAYLSSLPPPSSRSGNSEMIERGRAVFHSHRCDVCHEPPEYTTPKTYDVGLMDEVGNRSFNPPSLRGVSRRDAFLHDGRLQSLREVFARAHHPRGLTLSSAEIDDLVAFLESL